MHGNVGRCEKSGQITIKRSIVVIAVVDVLEGNGQKSKVFVHKKCKVPADLVKMNQSYTHTVGHGAEFAGFLNIRTIPGAAGRPYYIRPSVDGGGAASEHTHTCVNITLQPAGSAQICGYGRREKIILRLEADGVTGDRIDLIIII